MRNKHWLALLGIWLIVLAVGCGTVSVTSSPPEATVSVRLPGKEAPKELGKTPFSADLAELSDMVNEGTIILQVQKQGFIPQNFIIPNLGGGELKIETNLLPAMASNYVEVNRVVYKVLEAERLLLEKRFDDALKVSEEIKKINENVAAAFEVEATVHFLKNDFKNSRFAWVRVLELEPGNSEAQKMLALVEQKLGIKAGAVPTTGDGN